MADNDFRVICCAAKGDRDVFKVKASVDNDVVDLKMLVFEMGKHNMFRNIDPPKLILWQLDHSEPVDPDDALPSRIEKRGADLSKFATRLSGGNRISDLFPQAPQNGHLHVIVDVPHAATISPSSSKESNHSVDDSPPRKRPRIVTPPPNPPPGAVQRKDTLSALYQKMNSYRFVQVRGTPASGKSTLAKLLCRYIQDQEPFVHVIWVSGWKDADVKESKGWGPFLKTQNNWSEDENTVFVFDEAQLSYTDGALWNDFFKCMHDYDNRRAITFASYGNASSIFSIDDTPFFSADEARVSLLPISHEDNLPAAGLFFTRAEFDELVSTHYPTTEYLFHPSFLDKVFGITEGHVGAMRDFMNIVLSDDSYRELKLTTQRYTWEIFQQRVSLPMFLKQFERPAASIFRRGLPPDNDFKVLAVARVLSSVLRTGFVLDTDFTAEDDISALQRCFRNGWLHTDKLDNDNIGYFFASPLHRWYVEWKLWGIIDTTFNAVNIAEFVISVISIFSPRMLSTSRRIGPGGVQCPPEAQYQDEFYRCCHTRSNGSLVTFPESGTAKGRVDFYIPTKQWGVELLRDGDQLAQHSGRFSSQTGSYGTTLPLKDYIILDCRTTRPRVHHPHLPRLYHIVFGNNFHSVQILDNKLAPRGEFGLLGSS